MEFKVDENLHPDVADLLSQHGHDAMTVYEEGLRGHSDADVADVCRRETRALLTLDLDFADLRVYHPADFGGIIVFRLHDQSRPSVMQALGRLLPLFDTEPLAGHLWVVDEYQVRIRGSEQEQSPQ